MIHPVDKRELALIFAERLRGLVARHEGGLTGLARAAGVDRSALGQFLAPGNTRLPRAEALRRLAESAGVSTDWLLGLSFSEEGARELTPAVEIEAAVTPEGESPIARWHRAAVGYKIRYVPSSLPDQLCLRDVALHGSGEERQEQGRAVLDAVEAGDTDLEIAMPFQTLEDLAAGTGLWRALPAPMRRAQLERMARLAELHYPALRVHLYDGARLYAAPFTVFGPQRAALYLGSGYLVLTAAEDVRRLSRIFDGLVRAAAIGADRVHERLLALAARTR